jgi:tetratricopeptide (TPR) repeat protein
VGAGALSGVEAFQAADAQQREVAHWQFALLIHRQPGGDVLLRHLYLDSDRFKGVASVPPGVRYLLVPDVLELPDIPLASRLMQGLDAPPNGTDPAAWQLQRARVFILGGDTASGVSAMHQLLNAAAPAPVSVPAAASAAAPVKPATQVDPEELLQVLFDMQTLHKDKEALPFFEQLLDTDLAPEQRRQMLYWTADSYKAIGQYKKAAELYLRSAMLPGPFTLDPWAQTARYQAAGALAKAGLIEDARNLYKGLLNATRDPAQQAVLEHDLQQLGLMPAAGGELH